MRCEWSDMRCGRSDMRCGRSDMRCGRSDMRWYLSWRVQCHVYSLEEGSFWSKKGFEPFKYSRERTLPLVCVCVCVRV